MKNQKSLLNLTDQDLMPMARTEANYWKAKYFQTMLEIAKCNKGIKRLKIAHAQATLKNTKKRL